LIKSKSRVNVYFVVDGMRRHIVSGEVLEKFNFGWDKIKKMPQAKVDKIPESKDEIDLKAEDHMPFLTLE
jgi:hypothetical protein